jgi:hypothetical protein
VEPVGVLAGGDQQLSGDVGPDTVEGGQVGVDRGDQWGEFGVEFGDLGLEVADAAGESAQGGPGRGSWFGQAGRVGPEGRAGGD